MATIVRCDICKKASDETGVGHIGKDWEGMEYRQRRLKVKSDRDVCRACLTKVFGEVSFSKLDGDHEDY